VSHWVGRDLPDRVEPLGVRVTMVATKQAERGVTDAG
jgi:hypothetical protein